MLRELERLYDPLKGFLEKGESLGAGVLVLQVFKINYILELG